MGAASSAIGAALFWGLDFWDLWDNAKVLTPVALSFFSLFLLLALREMSKELEASKFSIEPSWQESQQTVWHSVVRQGKEYYELQTALKARFNNGDDVPHIVKTAELLLLRPRWYWKATCIGRSNFTTQYPIGLDGQIQRFDSSGPGIKVREHSMTAYMYLSFSTELPFGVSSLERHLGRVKFEILGQRERIIDMAVHCPRPHEIIRYDSEAKPLVSQRSEDLQ